MISVSIVTYKTDLDEMASCLRSLESPLVYDIYVIDNADEQRMADFCRGWDKIIYIGGPNVGYGAGHNKALRQVMKNKRHKYHLVLNSDVYFAPGVLDYLVDYMDRNPDVAEVQPNIIYPDGRQQYNCRLLPTPIDLIARRFMSGPFADRLNSRLYLTFADRQREINAPYLQGSFMFFRVECFGSVGLFDERFFMYPEDIDITRRMHRLYRTMYVPGATIVHAHRAASYKDKRMLRIHMKNMIKYFNKWGWLCDKERRTWNRQLLKELEYK